MVSKVVESCKYEDIISFQGKMILKANKSIYIARSRLRHDITLNNFLLHVPNHVLNDLYMLKDTLRLSTILKTIKKVNDAVLFEM